MWSTVALLCVATALLQVSAERAEYDQEWEAYKQKFQRTYSEDEEPHKRSVFEENMDYIKAHNQQAEAGEETFTMKPGPFTDMTEEELSSKLSTYRRANFQASVPPNGTYQVPLGGSLVPDYVNWVQEGIVTRVKSQLACDASWAFAATGCLESQHALKTRKLVPLSEQNLIDCATFGGNEGCNGGLVEAAFQYTILNNGIDTEESYPFEESDGVCRFDKGAVGATMSNYMVIPNDDEEALKFAVALIGPVAAKMDAKRSLANYGKGVYSGRECSSIMLNHSVLIVGYGSENGNDYWLIKNSWGPEWGQDGYMKLARDKNNMCGIATEACFPIV